VPQPLFATLEFSLGITSCITDLLSTRTPLGVPMINAHASAVTLSAADVIMFSRN
jgi:hypothetical protein